MTIEFFEDSNPVTRTFPPARSTIRSQNMINTKIEIEVIAYKP